MDKPYEIKKGTDLNWGIYSTEYNIRIATFNPNTEADRKQIKEMIQKPGVTKEWIRGWAQDLEDDDPEGKLLLLEVEELLKQMLIEAGVSVA